MGKEINVTFEFVWDKKKRLWLKVLLRYQRKLIPLSLATFMHFLHQKEGEMRENDWDFCLGLAKLIKKVQHGDSVIYAITSDYDMALFFKSAYDKDVVLMWSNKNVSRELFFEEFLPITFLVGRSKNQLCVSMEDRRSWLENPIAFLTFRTDQEVICFSYGSLFIGLPKDLEQFLLAFLDKKTLYYSDDQILTFIKQVFEPNKYRLFWKMQTDLTDFIPKETTPTPYLKLHYNNSCLSPELLYQYASELVNPNDKETVVVDKKSGKKYQRMIDMEAIYQQDLMTLFSENDLPFMLENPGDIAVFLDKVQPILIERAWMVVSEVEEFNVVKGAIDLEFSIDSSGQDWFHFDSNVTVMDQPFSLQELASVMIQSHGYLKTKKGFVKVSKHSQEALKVLGKMGAFKVGKTFSKSEILPMLTVANATGKTQEAKSFLERIRSIGKPQTCAVGAAFQGALRDYQQYGLNWMHFLYSAGMGGILADDMGLGKTIQVIAFVSQMERQHPVLVVGPTNVVYNWEKEIKTFSPSLKPLLYAGSNRDRLANKIPESDIVITSYGLLKNDISFFSGLQFDAFFIDEAQAIKNQKAQVSRAVKAVSSPFKIAMTGTPIENNIQDLYSLFDFIMPDYLGSEKTFDLDLQKHGKGFLKTKIKPFILRREKKEVLDALPEKIEIVVPCELSPAQSKLYRAVLEATKKGIKMAGKRDKLNILTALLKLRQVCTHPGILKEFKGDTIASGKYEVAQSKISELLSEGHKIVLFSQFTGMLDVFQGWLESEKHYFERIDGAVTGKARSAAVDRFQNASKPGIFLISLKAGGVGITLTAADYVIHMDPWWNPAVESQATDRVYRMGQKNKVIVYKLISKGTIEEKIQDLQAEKRALLSQVIDIDQAEEKAIDFKEIESLLLT